MAQARAALWTNDDVLEESAVHGACSRFLRQARARVAARPRRTVEVGESAVPRWQTLQRTDPWNCAYVFQRRPVVKLAESCTRFCALRIGSPDGGPVAPGLRLRSAAGGRRNAHTKSEPATRERPGLWHRRSEPSARRQLTERFGWVPSSPSWISLPRSCANATQSRGASMAIMQQTDFAEITIPAPSLAGPA